MTRRRAPFIALAATAALVLGGCSSDEQKAEDAIEEAAQDAGEDVEVDVDGDEVTIENSDGSVSLGGDLPTGFPTDDIPLVDGEVLMGVGAANEGYQVTMTVDSTAEEAVDEAVGLLEGAGFTLDESADMGTLQSATLSSEAFVIYVTATDVDEETTLSYAIEIL